MDEEEIERLIADLRTMLIVRGFGWAAAQAEMGVFSDANRYWVAQALIDAAESVTVDLAEVEIRMLDRLEVEDVEFKPDDDDDSDSDIGSVPPRHESRDDPLGLTENLRGEERRAVLQDLATRRSVFIELRRLLDVGE
jgi:hypothetical protein